MDKRLLLLLPKCQDFTLHYIPAKLGTTTCTNHSVCPVMGSLLADSPMHPASKQIHNELTCQFLNSNGSHSPSHAMDHSLSPTRPRNCMNQQVSTVPTHSQAYSNYPQMWY